MKFEIVVRNSAKCLLCGQEIESTHRHDFRPCKCGALTVDGGRAYRRRLYQGEGEWIDTSILAEEPATKEQLAVAAELLSFAKTGLVPTEADWADAPLLEQWRVVEARVPPAADDMQELEGDVLGHPDFRDDQRIRTTPLLYAPNGKNWARTMTRYFRLGTPAKGDTKLNDDSEPRERLDLATALHAATMPVVDTMLTPRDSVVSISDLHFMCGVAERVERAADHGPDDEAFLGKLSTLMQLTAEVRGYVDERLLDGRYKASALVVLRDIKKPDALMRAKWELMRVAALALEDAGMTVADVAGAVGEAAETLQRWLDGMVRDVSLDRLAGLHAVVAEQTDSWPLAWLIGGKPGEDDRN